jgi:hypothetical protein
MRINAKKNRLLAVIFLLLVLCGVVFLFTFSRQGIGKAQPLQWEMGDTFAGIEGSWNAACSLNALRFHANDEITLSARLNIASKEFQECLNDYEGLGMMIIAERLYDNDGRPHLMNNNFMSTVLTPTGMPVEFFVPPSKNGYQDENLF